MDYCSNAYIFSATLLSQAQTGAKRSSQERSGGETLDPNAVCDSLVSLPSSCISNGFLSAEGYSQEQLHSTPVRPSSACVRPGSSDSADLPSSSVMAPTLLPFDAALSSNEAFNSLVYSVKPFPTPQEVDVHVPSNDAAPPSGDNPLFNALRTPELRVHDSTIHPTPSTENLTLTDNGGITNASSLSPTLDLFAELSSLRRPDLAQLLADAWSSDSLETLRIIWSARSIPRGKGEKEAWTRAAAWLAEKHPQTLLRNLDWVVRPTDLIPQKRKAEEASEEDEGDLCEVGKEEEREVNPSTARSHGYFKDLLNLVVLSSLPSASTSTGSELSVEGDFTRVPGFIVDPSSPYAATRSRQKKNGGKAAKDATSKGDAKFGLAQRLEQSLATEGGFHRALHLTVARVFGLQLEADLAALKSSKELRAAGKNDEARIVEGRISLATKWAPSEGAFHDRHTRLASTIAEFLTPLPSLRTPSSLVHSLSVYRTTYLVPLRAHLDLVERKMSANDWTSISYSRVPSIAMDTNKKLFAQHDPEGFKAFLYRVAEGKSTISGAALTPASLLKQAERADDVEAEVIEAQWRTLVQSVRDAGKLSRCLAVADVSGSMGGPQLADGTTPLNSSLALAILVSQVTEPPFSNAVISFSESPHFIDLTGSTLAEHSARIRDMGVGYNTDFVAVFRVLLARAVDAQLSKEQMVSRVFVFSDMGFDSAECARGDYATHHAIIKREFEEAGYELPELVYWNLAARSGKGSKPVTANEEGTALVSGYSAAMVKVFLEGGEWGAEAEEWEEVGEDGETKSVRKAMDPLAVMRKAIGPESFAGLKVYD